MRRLWHSVREYFWHLFFCKSYLNQFYRADGRRIEFQFERSSTGDACDVQSVSCPRCKNFIWIPLLSAQLEKPRFCAYCGLHYKGSVQAPDEDVTILTPFEPS